MGFIKDYIKESFEEQAGEQWRELKRVTKSVFGYHKDTEEVISESKYNNYLLIKYELKSGSDTYEVYDPKNNLLYKAVGTFWLGRHHLIFYKGKQKIGEIKKKLYVLPDIDDWHTDRHRCVLYLYDKEINYVEAYRKEKKQVFEIKRNGWKIKYNATEDHYSLTQKNGDALQLNEISKYEYLISYDEVKNLEEIILLTIAFFQNNKALTNQ